MYQVKINTHFALEQVGLRLQRAGKRSSVTILYYINIYSILSIHTACGLQYLLDITATTWSEQGR